MKKIEKIVKDYKDSRFNLILETKDNSFEWYILFIEKTGKAFARLYSIDKTFVLDFLTVDESIRKQGVGTQLQEIREEIVKKLGKKSVYLYVNKYSWMQKWYERRGYKYWSEYESDEKMIWLKKIL